MEKSLGKSSILSFNTHTRLFISCGARSGKAPPSAHTLSHPVVSASPAAASATLGVRPVYTPVASSTSGIRQVRPVYTPAASGTASTPQVQGYLGWSSLGCYPATQAGQKLLTLLTITDAAMDVKRCEDQCRGMGYSIAGLEGGKTCNCGTQFSHCASTVASSSCSSTCAGTPSQTCGGSNVMNVYAVSGYSFNSATCSATSTASALTSRTTQKSSVPTLSTTTTSRGSPTTLVSKTSSSKTTTTSSKPSQTYSVGQAYTGVPGAKNANKVFAHYMIGNMYSVQTVAEYVTEIQLAINMGVDGFACNIGTETWQADRLRLMYAAAAQVNAANPGSFVLFVSLDMAVLNNVGLSYLYPYITDYTNHGSTYKINGLQYVSTFAGESYTGGPDAISSDPAAVWLYFKNQLAQRGTEIYFVPAFTGAGPTTYGWDAVDGLLNWSAFTHYQGGDSYYMSKTSNGGDTSVTTGRNNGAVAQYSGKTYMAGIAPWFYSEFAGKFEYMNQDDLYTTRWEWLISSQPDFVEIISWNDYGESHYLGNIYGSLPADGADHDSRSWANADFDHTALGELTKYYVTAYKNKGTYPAITKNQMYIWYRPHSVTAQAPAGVAKPSCARPEPNQGDHCPDDNIYLTALVTRDTTFAVRSGTVTQTFSCPAGTRCHFVYKNFSEGKPHIDVTTGGKTTSIDATLAINNAITRYNFNLHVESYTF
ncbi:Glucan endo-1,3-alpha-glucosidase Agn1 [Taphrina deformans PYCC 5710]|uniref:Glucan endo-1,3-alpha-glucosidase Agn1 n=1 Tax=Taphrina deformans (strain PYCC 5710 / ATCC 11124 / CBS 356.35 / IMI 108563 / JCM 9778 / NBRC 8474) TaxID=1097556 RepID=R4XBP1_TAPDE|nr:Glucan endo-1,3-alpha-glucosidase Agn1 [Taphrina deformans PYCC 5710]|eukprot:CCG80753.1 Glucan endo-1,3-alpha-glucosidase Agn1 [Taphrina deformans PYCC 5710]